MQWLVQHGDAALECALDPNDITLHAADRLEAALERLAAALDLRMAELRAGRDGTQEDMVPRAEVDRLSARLDDALARLRSILGEDLGADLGAELTPDA